MHRFTAIPLAALLLLSAVQVSLCDHLAASGFPWLCCTTVAQCHAPAVEDAIVLHDHQDQNHDHASALSSNTDHPACPGGDCCDDIPDAAIDVLAASEVNIEKFELGHHFVALPIYERLVVQTPACIGLPYSRPPPSNRGTRSQLRAAMQVFTI